MASIIQQMSRAVDLLEQGNSQTCILTLQTLLLQPRLPFFWRIHALTLLAHSVDDWFEAKVRAPSRVQPSPGGRRTTLIMMQTYQRQAEMLWRLSRRLLAEDVDHEFDRTLRINRGFLDQIAVELIEEMPDELRGLREEAEEGPGQVADGDKETCGNDGDGPDGEHDKSPDAECNDYADHSGESQEVETSGTSPGCSFDDTTHGSSKIRGNQHQR
jgi:hypothetical protein